jgi:dihydrofolate reductase
MGLLVTVSLIDFDPSGLILVISDTDKMRVSLFVETSKDGFIAAEDGNMDFFKESHAVVPAGETCGYTAFLESTDAVVMGRKTFDVVKNLQTAQGEQMWWYGSKPLFVLSRDASRVVVPASLQASGANVTHLFGTPTEALAKLEALGFRHVYVDGGGEVIRQFIASGLVDDATVTVLPMLLGKGIPFLASEEHKRKLKAVVERNYSFGFTQTAFNVDRVPDGV